MSAIKKVALAGASGNIGSPILEQLVASNAFDITVLTRESSTASFPSTVTVKKVNYDDVSSLTSALSGIDALVSTIATASLASQTKLIDAAIAADVQRFLPSEFGADRQNPKSAQLPVFAPKIEIQKYLQEKADEGKITWSAIITGPFFDWGLKVGFVLDVKGKKGKLYDGGDALFSTSTLATIGKAVVGTLKKPEQTKNRVVYVKDADVTQNKLIAITDKYNVEGEWQLEQVNTDTLVKDSFEKLGKGDFGQGTWVGFLIKSIYGKGYGGVFQKPDNELLGIPLLTEQEVEETVAKVIKG